LFVLCVLCTPPPLFSGWFFCLRSPLVLFPLTFDRFCWFFFISVRWRSYLGFHPPPPPSTHRRFFVSVSETLLRLVNVFSPPLFVASIGSDHEECFSKRAPCGPARWFTAPTLRGPLFFSNSSPSFRFFFGRGDVFLFNSFEPLGFPLPRFFLE